MSVTFNPYFKLKYIDLSDDTQVNSGGGQSDKTLKPDLNFIYEIVDMFIHIPDPVGSTANSHRIEIYNNGEVQAANRKQYYSSNTGSDIYFGQYWRATATSEIPNSDQISMMALAGHYWLSNTYYLTIRYVNGTDANQTGTRTIKILVKEYIERL